MSPDFLGTIAAMSPLTDELCNVHYIDELPEEINTACPERWCYTSDKGFYARPRLRFVPCEDSMGETRAVPHYKIYSKDGNLKLSVEIYNPDNVKIAPYQIEDIFDMLDLAEVDFTPEETYFRDDATYCVFVQSTHPGDVEMHVETNNKLLLSEPLNFRFK